MAAQGKLGPLAAKALTQVGIPEQQKPPVDLAARLDTPLGDLIKQHRKEPRSLLERARAKAGAKAKAKAKGQAGNAGVNSKVTKKVIAKDAKAAVRSILSSASHNQKPKPNAPRPAPHLVPAGKKLTINRKPAAAAHHKAGAKPAAAPKLTISLKNDRKPNKPAARVQLKNTNPAGGHRAIVVANAAQKRQDQRQQVVQARRVIQPGQAHSPKPAAAAAKGGLTLSERFSQAKPKQQQQQQQHGGGGRKVNVKGGRQQGGASFRVNLN